MSEIIRAGLLSVDPGQELAGRALGMSRRQILRKVVIPQAVRIIIPRTSDADYKCFLYLREFARKGVATALAPVVLFDLLKPKDWPTGAPIESSTR